MIIIDRSKPVQSIILTLTESSTTVDPTYVMKLKCDATRNEYEVLLPENISTATVRYDLFQILTNDFKDLEEGYFSFTVYMSPDMVNSIEEGKLQVKNSITPATEDQYIVYSL